MSSERRIVSLLLLLAALLFLYGAAQLPLLGPDEPRYSQVARQMRESGDYIIPRLGDFAWFEKPVLLYWMMAGFFSIFGVTEIAARFPSALSALLTAAIVYTTVRRSIGPVHAFGSTLILITTVFFIGFSHAATFDMLLTLTTTASLCLFILWQLDPDKQKYLYGTYFFLGMGILAKGFVAPILVGLAVASYSIAAKQWNVARLKPISGFAIVIGVAALWFLPVTAIYGWRFWEEFVYQHHFVRYTSSYYHRSGSIFFYIPILLIGTFPWTLAPLLKKPDTSTAGRRILFGQCLCWLLSSVLFFSFSQSKLPGYILPAIPAFAMLAGVTLVDSFQNRLQTMRWIWIPGTWNILVAAILLYVSGKFPEITWPVRIFSALLVFFTIVAIFLARRRAFVAALCAYSLIAISALFLTVHALPDLLNWYESRQLSLSVLPQLSGDRKLVFYNVYDFAPLFYTNGRVELTPEGYLYNIANDRQLYRYLSFRKEAYVVVGNEELNWINAASFWRVTGEIHGRQNSIVHLQAK